MFKLQGTFFWVTQYIYIYIYIAIERRFKVLCSVLPPNPPPLCDAVSFDYTIMFTVY